MTNGIFGKRSAMAAVAAMAVVAASAASSCGGSGGGTTGFSTSVPGDKPLSGLTAAELSTLCMDIGRAFANDSAFKSSACKFAGFTTAAFLLIDPQVTDAALQAACMQTYDACLANPGTGMCEMPDATCMATVSELGACIGDTKVSFQQLAAAIPSCGSLTKASLGSGGGDAGTPMESAACMAFNAKCPNNTLIPDPTGGP